MSALPAVLPAILPAVLHRPFLRARASAPSAWTSLILGLTLISALLLSSCQSMTPQERRALDERTCRGYGFKMNTDAMAQCLLQLDLDRRADMRAFQARSSLMWDRPMILERRVIVERR